jgi:hypothetical protein
MKVTEIFLVRRSAGTWAELVKWSHEDVKGWAIRGAHGWLYDVTEAEAMGLIEADRAQFDAAKAVAA